jgi:hypothetical protein
MRRLIVFDLDGTLAKSKSSVDSETSSLIHALLGVARVAVISGGAWPQFEAQLLAELPRDDRLMKMLFIGDALFVGGNDQPAREAGVLSIQVRDPDETKRVIETLLACLQPPEGATSAGTGEARIGVPGPLGALLAHGQHISPSLRERSRP